MNAYGLGENMTFLILAILLVTPVGYSTAREGSKIPSGILSTGSNPPTGLDANPSGDFTIASNPSSFTIETGVQSSILAVRSLNLFTGNVSLQVSISGPQGGLIASSLEGSVVPLASGQTGYSIFSVSVSGVTRPGDYNFTITGTTGRLYHTIVVRVVVVAQPLPDFSQSASLNQLTVAMASSGTSTISLESLNGFSGDVEFSLVVCSSSGCPAVSDPGDVAASISPSHLSLGGETSRATAILKVSASASTHVGGYSVRVIGRGNGVSHQTALVIFVIERGPTTTPVRVSIDIKPGSHVNRVNLNSHGLILVAVLSTPQFDATKLDPSTIRFGSTGTEAAPVHATLEDVDDNGDLDMVLHFRIQQTGLHVGDTIAVLMGSMLDGTTIEGQDSVTAFLPGH